MNTYNQADYLETALKAEVWISRHAKKTDHGLGGWAGYCFVLDEIAKATGDDAFRVAAHRCAQALRDQASSIGAGIGWIAPMPYANLTGQRGEREIYDVAEGAAGVAYFMARVFQTSGTPEQRD